jgi:hypothetical protein
MGSNSGLEGILNGGGGSQTSNGGGGGGSEEAEFKFDRVQKAYKLLQRDDEEILADEEKSEKMETFKKVRRVILLISQ